jgi:hypothetical protein
VLNSSPVGRVQKDLYQKLSQVRPDKDPRYERIFIANQFDLKVVDGKIPIPDLRIEYEDDCRDVRRLDLEVATRDYRPQWKETALLFCIGRRLSATGRKESWSTHRGRPTVRTSQFASQLKQLAGEQSESGTKNRSGNPAS